MCAVPDYDLRAVADSADTLRDQIALDGWSADDFTTAEGVAPLADYVIAAAVALVCNFVSPCGHPAAEGGR